MNKTFVIIDCATGEIIEAPLTAEQLAQHDEDALPPKAQRDTEKARLERAVARAKVAAPFAGVGRGIVTIGGGAYFPSAYVQIKALRHFGCELPVELWYDGKREMNEETKEVLAALNVSTRDARAEIENRENWVHGFWEMKHHAVAMSQFQEVFFLDADSMPVTDVTRFFDDADYLANGFLTWPGHVGLEAESPIWRVLDQPACALIGFSGGEFLIDKAKHSDVLRVSCHFGDNAKYWLNLMFSDCQTLQFAFHVLDKPYTIVEAEMNVEHDEHGGALCTFQHDKEGKCCFQHLAAASEKWTIYRPNVFSENFEHRELVQTWLDELRALPIELRGAE